MSPDPRLHKLLGGAALAGLRQRLRRLFERMPPGSQPEKLRLSFSSDQEFEAMALLTGRPPRPAKSMLVELATLDATLREAGVAHSLRDALEQLEGPIAWRAGEEAERRERWASVAASCGHPALLGYLRAPAALGLLKKLASQDPEVAAELLRRAEMVLRRLPAGGLPRAQLAAETLGNAHALDSAQPTATLVLGAWRRLQGEAAEPEMPGDEAEREESSRDTWARAGVAVNELARPALLLNLPLRKGAAPVGAPGEPAYLSLRQLLRSPPAWAVAGIKVFVCENPNLVAIAADTLGPRCRPLICTDGAPAAAQRTLLNQLTRAGARLAYHGDFDWPGLRIANHLVRVHGANPWRMAATDYEAAVKMAPPGRKDLGSPAIAASWDAALAPAMQHHGLAIAEEAVAATLLADLRL